MKPVRINKYDLIQEVRRRIEIDVDTLEKIINVVQNIIYQELRAGNEVKLPGLCVFKSKIVEQREYIDISTPEREKKISQRHRLVKIKPLPTLVRKLWNV